MLPIKFESRNIGSAVDTDDGFLKFIGNQMSMTVKLSNKLIDYLKFINNKWNGYILSRRQINEIIIKYIKDNLIFYEYLDKNNKIQKAIDLDDELKKLFDIPDGFSFYDVKKNHLTYINLQNHLKDHYLLKDMTIYPRKDNEINQLIKDNLENDSFFNNILTKDNLNILFKHKSHILFEGFSYLYGNEIELLSRMLMSLEIDENIYHKNYKKILALYYHIRNMKEKVDELCNELNNEIIDEIIYPDIPHKLLKENREMKIKILKLEAEKDVNKLEKMFYE